MTLHGIDISQYQGTVDFDKVASEVDFVVMRSTSGDGGLHRDSKYATYIKAARAHNMLRGVYHYAGGLTSPFTEGDYFVNNTARKDGEVQMLDFEGHVLTIANPVTWAKTWLDHVHALTHNRPMIYMSQSVVSSHDWRPVVNGGYGLVVARWGDTSPSSGQWPFWAMWQNADNGKIGGISGPVDTDIFNGGKSQFLAYGRNENSTVLPPAPPKQLTYTVAHGDTLIGIAQMWHVPDWHDLYELNAGIIGPNPNLIHEGLVLKLPAGAHRG